MSKKKDMYVNERNEVLNKILNILEITDTNKIIALKKLDEDKEKQQQIIDLEPEIKKYFQCCRWAYFSNKHTVFKRNYLSLTKSIMKEMNVNMASAVLVKKLENGKCKCETYYVFDLQ